MLAGTLLLAASALADVTISNENDKRVVKADGYEATVDADGCLSQVVVGGKEFLRPGVNISRGSYFYTSTSVKLTSVQQQGSTITADGEKAKASFEFSPTSMKWTVSNLTDGDMHFYIVLDFAANAAKTGDNQFKRLPTTMNGKSITIYRDGASLNFDGLSAAWGPWNGLQVLEVRLAGKQTQELTVTAGKATAEDLQKIATLPAAATQPVIRPAEPTTQPRPRDENWVKRHEGFVEIARKGDVDLLFVGDSITDGWRGRGKAVWDANFAPLKAANFGIGGDRTQHVLWRLQNGELEGIKPRLCVLMIGTNNLGNSNADIIAGIQAIIKEMHVRQPQMKILLLGIFPRTAGYDRIKQMNQTLSQMKDPLVSYMDIGAGFLNEQGEVPKEIMPDGLHPNEKGYAIWAAAIIDKVKELLQ